MISEAPARLLSWLKQPRSLIANLGIGVAALAIVATPVAAYAITSANDNANQQAQKVASVEDKENTVPTKGTTEEVAKTEANTPESTTQEQNSGSSAAPREVQPQAPATQPAPTAPTPAVYADTYPDALKSAPLSSKLDQWGLDNRQSTSYTAWKVNEAFGNMPKWGYAGNGNASNWPTLADNANIARGTTPKVHSVGVSGNFTVWVEAVNGDKIDVSFYNWGNSGTFGYWNDIPASQYATYIYFQ